MQIIKQTIIIIIIVNNKSCLLLFSDCEKKIQCDVSMTPKQRNLTQYIHLLPFSHTLFFHSFMYEEFKLINNPEISSILTPHTLEFIQQKTGGKMNKFQSEQLETLAISQICHTIHVCRHCVFIHCCCLDKDNKTILDLTAGLEEVHTKSFLSTRIIL